MKSAWMALSLAGLLAAAATVVGNAEEGAARRLDDIVPRVPGEIVTIAGGASVKKVSNPHRMTLIGLCSLAADNQRGLLYISDSTLHQILRLDLEHDKISTFAGNEFGGYNGDGKPALETEFQVPCEMAIHPKTGDVYLVDTNNYRVRAVARDGSRVWTVAGIGVAGVPERQLPTVPPVGKGLEYGKFSGDGGPPDKAEVNLPAGVAFDTAGNLYISDSANNRVRVVNNEPRERRFAGVMVKPGTIQTIVGRGPVGYTGDGAKAVDALIAHPRQLVVDRAGNVWFVDSLNEALRRVDGSTGIIETVVRTRNDPWQPDTQVLFPPSIDGLAIAANGDIYYSNLNRHSVFVIPAGGGGPVLLAGVGVRGLTVPDGSATRTPVSGPGALAIGRQNELYLVEILSNVVRRVQNGRLVTVAGGGSAGEGVPATQAFFSVIGPIQVAPGGDLYIGDLNLQSIRRVLAANGIVETFAGKLANGSARKLDDWRIARHARATNLDFDGPDVLYVTDGGFNVVRRFTRNDKVWTVDTYAGDGKPGDAGDGGPATQAELSVPIALGRDRVQGSLAISGIYHPRIRVVDRQGIIHEYAGNGIAGYSGDGGPAPKAAFNWPTGVGFDQEGNGYIADFFNNRIRRVSREGTVTTFAGTGEPGYSGDGGPAAQARLYNPAALVVDKAGNIYFADANNHVVRRIDAKAPHVITTVAGNGTRGFSGDGGPATKAMLNVPRGVALQADGRVLYIADSLNRRIRAVRLPE